jgi:hypothetical protein
MGLIGRLIGVGEAAQTIGQAATGVAEVFTPNATRKMEAAHEAYMAALSAYGAEFQYARPGLFDRFVNGINRLPRPMMALGTLGLFGYSMVDPAGFSQRMIGLDTVPEPLWWLLAAIVSFYFGAREAHYFRTGPRRVVASSATPLSEKTAARDSNLALDEWRQKERGRDR